MATAVLNRDNFRTLFEDHYDLICNYLNAQTHDWDLSQEVAQKTFVKIWEKRKDISFDTSPKSYLFQTARNTLIDHYRSHKSMSSNAEQYTEQLEKAEDMAGNGGGGLVVTQKITWAVDQLKSKTREIFLLNKQEGLTYDEIADYLEISKRTVEYNVKSALIQVRDLLKDKIY